MQTSQPIRRSAAAAAVVLSFLAPAAVGSPSVAARDEAVVARVDAVVEKALENPAAVGLSVAVALDDEIVLAKGYGLAEVEHGVPVHAGTTFRIGSVTKQFTAAAIVRLAERDKLAIDEDMRAYLPDYPELPDGHVVTLRHLLTHTSGIPSYTDLGQAFWSRARVDLDHEAMLAIFAELPLDFAPGERWAYNNSGYYLLGMVLEEVTGQGYAEYMQATFFEPLGLDSMRYGSFEDIIPDRAQGYRFEDGELANDAFMSMTAPGAAGALLANAEDLVKWQLALVSGKVVSPESYAEMTTPFLLGDMSETEYGFGLSLAPIAGRPAVRHGGGIFGFNSELAYLPEERVSVAVISNCEGFASGMLAADIVRAVLAE